MHDAKINVSLNLHIFFRVQKMKFHGEEQSVLGDFLIRFASIGIFAYSTFNMVAGGLGPHSDLKNLLILATGGITIIQVFQLYYWSNNDEKISVESAICLLLLFVAMHNMPPISTCKINSLPALSLS